NVGVATIDVYRSAGQLRDEVGKVQRALETGADRQSGEAVLAGQSGQIRTFVQGNFCRDVLTALHDRLGSAIHIGRRRIYVREGVVQRRRVRPIGLHVPIVRLLDPADRSHRFDLNIRATLRVGGVRAGRVRVHDAIWRLDAGITAD